MVNDCDIELLIVCLPNYLAAAATIFGLENDCHVFCEKPPARTVKEVQDVIACSKKYPHLKLKYGFNHRYHDSVRKARQIIDSKDLGEIVSLRGVYGKSSIVPFESGWRAEKKYAGGGILLDQGIHMLDLILYFSEDFDGRYFELGYEFTLGEVDATVKYISSDSALTGPSGDNFLVFNIGKSFSLE